MKAFLVILLFVFSCHNDKSIIKSKFITSSIRLTEIDSSSNKQNFQPSITLSIRNNSKQDYYLDNDILYNLKLEVYDKNKKAWKDYTPIWINNQTIIVTEPFILSTSKNDTLIKKVCQELIERTFYRCIDEMGNANIDTNLIHREVGKLAQFEVILLSPGTIHKEILAINTLKSPTEKYRIYWHYKADNQSKGGVSMDIFEYCHLEYPDQLDNYQRVKSEVFSDTLYFDLK